MRCPRCDSENIIEGLLAVKKSVGNFLMWGFGSSELRFYEKSGRRTRIMRSGQALEAWACSECGTLIASPSP